MNELLDMAATPEQVKDGVLAVLAALGAVAANLLGGWDTLLAVLCGMMAADYVTGLMIAAVWKKSNKSETGRLDSNASFKGLVRKCTVLVLVWIAVMLDNAIGTHYIRSMVILFYVGNEGLSLMENLCIMGVPHPAFLEDMLQALKKQGDEGEHKTNES